MRATRLGPPPSGAPYRPPPRALVTSTEPTFSRQLFKARVAPTTAGGTPCSRSMLDTTRGSAPRHVCDPPPRGPGARGMHPPRAASIGALGSLALLVCWASPTLVDSVAAAAAAGVNVRVTPPPPHPLSLLGPGPTLVPKRVPVQAQAPPCAHHPARPLPPASTEYHRATEYPCASDSTGIDGSGPGE